MDGKTFLLLLLSIGWIFLCQRWYCCWMQVACAACSDEPINQLAIGFLPGEALPDTTAVFQELVNNIKKDKPESAYLEISGRYYKDEINAATLGIDRAENTKQLLRNYFPNDSIQLRSQQIIGSIPKQKAFRELIDIQWLPLPEEELTPPEKLLIYFGNKNTQRDITGEALSALLGLIEYANVKQRKILVDGHSDKSGNEIGNIKFSLERALFVKNKLIDLGFDEDKIVVNKYGSSRPLEGGDLSMNRRVEVYLEGGNGAMIQ